MSAAADREPPPAIRRVADALLGLLAVTLPMSTSGMQIAVVGLIVLSLVSVAGRWAVVRRTPLDGAVALFLAVCAVSTLASLHIRQAVGWASLWIVSAYFVVFWWVRDCADAARFTRRLVGSAAVVATYGILQHFTGIDLYRGLLGRTIMTRPRAPGDRGVAVIGFFRSYLTFGHAMLPPFALAAAGVVSGRFRDAVACLLVAIAVLYSTARGAWLGLAAIALTLGVLDRSRAVARAALGLIALVVVVLSINVNLRDEARQMWTLGGVNQARLAIYAANRDIIHDHPFLGLGFGRYRLAARSYYDAHPLADRRSHAHNNYLQIAAESGLMGLAAFMAIYAVALARGWAALATTRDPARRETLLGPWAAIVGFMVGGLTQYTFGDSEVALSAWVMLALLLRGASADGATIS